VVSYDNEFIVTYYTLILKRDICNFITELNTVFVRSTHDVNFIMLIS